MMSVSAVYFDLYYGNGFRIVSMRYEDELKLPIFNTVERMRSMANAHIKAP